MLIWKLSNQFIQIPALGVFLNPFRGAVQNEETKNVSRQLEFQNRSFEIVFDDRSVPHVFSENSSDMYFAQGYVLASDRLWQMDFLSYVSAGRLSELLGNEFVNFNRMQRRIGMLESAKVSLELIEQDNETITALNSYTADVNA